MKSGSILVVILVLTLAGGLAAQPYGTDLFASNIRNVGGSLFGDVLRIDPNGVITTALVASQFAPAFPNMVRMDNNNRDLVVMEVCYTVPPNVLKIYDVNLKAAVGTLRAPGGINLTWFDRTGTGDYYVVGGTNVFLMRRDGSGTSTIRSGAPFIGLHTCVQDLATGGVVVGETHVVYLVAPNGAITTTWRLTNLTPISMTQDHRDGTIIIGSASQVLGFHQNGTITTIHSSTRTNCNAITFDRWTGNGEIVVGSNPIVRMTVGGVIVTTHFGIPPLANSGMCFDRERNLVCVKTGSPNRYRYDLDVPTQPGKPYVLGLSLTDFRPGIPIGGRRIQLVPDAVLAASVTGALHPFLQNNIGLLSPAARASATLDLKLLGGLLKGFRLWAAAVTLDAGAPKGIGVITKPTITVLE